MAHPCPHWYRIMFTGAKTHLVPGSLRTELLFDMAARDCLPMSASTVKGIDWAPIERVRSYGLDTSGMCYVDEPWIGMKLDNLPLEFPCSGVLGFLYQVRRLEKEGVRRFASDRPYYKVHGSLHCMTLTPRQFHRLHVLLEQNADRAEETAHVFFADKRKPTEILRNVQAEARGLDPEALGPVEKFGTSTADRFIPRERGEA